MSVYFSSDTHFAHNRDFIFEPRGFHSADEMNVTQLARINEKVERNDTLYLLGDLIMGQSDISVDWLYAINCRNIKMIIGNHDFNKNRMEQIGKVPTIEILGYAHMTKIDKQRLYLSHYPTVVTNFKKDGMLCLCGHSHTTDKFVDIDKGCYHVDMDAHNCYPISLEEIITDIKNFKGDLLL